MLSSRIFSGILFVLAIIGIYIGWGIHSDFNYEPLGPRPFPIATLALIAFCSILLLFFAEDTKVEWGNLALWKKLIILAIALLLYALCFEFLGFIICTACLMFIMALLFNANVLKALIFSIVSSFILYYFFDNLLQITLPFGFIFDYFN
ncbi:tripartite tricarboxylate transporter TctB family protein [Campylobacter sp. MIT 97-5078]|uniref:tripartite tricarboxylate transporter TctB family protein n=1 Tax=Campylobacter sp. MIT 97-5078 TaxID=1548153 RepID=UPI0005146FEE|nr:tripartite tricarboxylate transporter TctB family protein [Campylobacter sp. MIT 97-5078]KGI57260.1 tricarboxylate transporter [Campylobacter sp. MIT 97-5078]TQR27469.1 tripartite tricarboxylate transporter TctB family protein [Campylobacter sp. MIT 97-5078]